MKHHRKRWVRRNRHKQSSLIAMHRLAKFLGEQHPCIFHKISRPQRRPMLQ